MKMYICTDMYRLTEYRLRQVTACALKPSGRFRVRPAGAAERGATQYDTAVRPASARSLHALVELAHELGVTVCAAEHVPPHEGVPVVVDECLVMHVVIGSGTQSELAKERVPRMRRL